MASSNSILSCGSSIHAKLSPLPFPATSPVSVLPPGGDRTLQRSDGGLHGAEVLAVAVENDQRPVAAVAGGVAEQLALLGPVAEIDRLETHSVLGADERGRAGGRVV